VDIQRPRDRKELNHDPRFREIRRGVLEYLLDSGKAKRAERDAAQATEKAAAPTAEAVQIAEVNP
jgi:nitrate/nitrite transport system ATP-binding protein